MGFLNHATNNIIIDAVLTERGRELLSKNDGSFSIASFTFGDDEVDYSIIEKYGNPIGKEKIEKNTPIFEANPNENIAIKHKLISFPSPLTRITAIPTLTKILPASDIELFDSTGSGGTNPVNVEIKVQTQVGSDITSIDPNLSDGSFFVKLHGELLKMETDSGTLIETDINNVDLYTVDSESVSGGVTNQVSATFKIFSNDVVSASSFTKFSMIGNANKINTSVQIIGASSGASIIIPIVINKSTTN